jgi:hypothetical protein
MGISVAPLTAPMAEVAAECRAKYDYFFKVTVRLFDWLLPLEGL